jgi:RNA polymerase sigma-70 factor (ECF subfamily)
MLGARAVVKTIQSGLLEVLVAGYDDFKRRLAIRLGSTELAADALQDTFLRLQSATIGESVQSPRAYVLRTALNIAINRLVAERRRATVADIEALIEIADDAPGPSRIAEGRSELAELTRALHELPQRRRDILVAVTMNDTPIPALAKRFGVTVRTIQIELKQALIFCAHRVDRRPTSILMRRERPIVAVGLTSDGGAQDTRRRSPIDNKK